MNALYKMQLRLYCRRKIFLANIVIFILLILITVSNSHQRILFTDVIAQMSNTFEKDLLYIPGCAILICGLWDDRLILKSRFKSRKTWLTTELRFVAMILFCYSLLYLTFTLGANAVATCFLKGNGVIRFSDCLVIILVFIRRFLFAFLILIGTISGNILTGKGIPVVCFFCYFILEIIQLLELLTPVKVFTPRVDIDLPLSLNVILALPTLILLLTGAVFLFYNITNEGKQ